MKIGSKEHYNLLKQFEKNFAEYRLDKEKDKEDWKNGYVYEDGEVNKLFKAFEMGYSCGRLQYLY